MGRKVVKHGPSTYIVSLPSKWAKENSIGKGDEVEVQEQGDTLIISAKGRSREIELEADLSGLDRTTIMYTIRSFYRLGYDTLRLKFNQPTALYQRADRQLKVISIIHKEVNRLIGYEIMQEKENSCVIKDLQEMSSKDFSSVLRRVFLLLTNTSKELMEGLEKNNNLLLETIEEKHDTITKFVSYCMRILNKSSPYSPQKTAYYYHILAYLDRITDILKYAARDAIKYGKKFDNSVLEIIRTVHQDLEAYYQLFYKFDNKQIMEINERRYFAEKQLRKLPPKTDKNEVIIAANLFQILEILLDLIEARTALEN